MVYEYSMQWKFRVMVFAFRRRTVLEVIGSELQELQNIKEKPFSLSPTLDVDG
jgi:hypothetical protein